MYRKTLAICAALVAFGALAIAPAMSSAAALRETVGGVNTLIEPGKKIVAYNEEGTAPTLKSPVFEVKCSESIITGSVHANPGGGKEKVVLGTIEDAWFQGPEGAAGETKCFSTIGNATVTVQLTNQLEKNTHWCIETIKNSDEFQAVPHSCTGEGGKFTFIIHAGGMTCGFQRTEAIKGTYTTGDTANAPVTLTMNNGQKFTTESVINHSILCPASGELFEFKFQMYTDLNGTSNAWRPAKDVAAPVNLTES
jgi:hypothetical protein